MTRVKEKGQGLEIHLTPRRVVIKPKKKRNEYIKRLDKAIQTLEAIINSEKTHEKIRIQAANSLARLISTSYTMIVDIEVETIEKEIENLNKMMEEEEKPSLGYTVEEEDTPPPNRSKNKSNKRHKPGNPENETNKIQPLYQR